MKRRATEVCVCTLVPSHTWCVCMHSIVVCGVLSVSICLPTLSILTRYRVCVCLCVYVCVLQNIDEITQTKKVAEEDKEEEEEEKENEEGEEKGDNKEEERKAEEANTGACAEEDTAHTTAAKPTLTKKDSIEEALICQICQVKPGLKCPILT